MGIGFGKELDTARLGKGAEAVEHLGSKTLKLVKGDARDGESDLETRTVALDELEEEGIHGEVSLGSYLFNNLRIGIIVKVIVRFANVEKAVATETEGLVHLEVKTDG